MKILAKFRGPLPSGTPSHIPTTNTDDRQKREHDGIFKEIPSEELRNLELDTTSLPRSEQQQQKPEPEDFIQVYREPHGGFALRRIDSEGRTPEDRAKAKAAEEEAERLRKREKLLKREEDLQRRRESDQTHTVMRGLLEQMGFTPLDESHKQPDLRVTKDGANSNREADSTVNNAPHFDVLDDSGPAARLSVLLNKIPVWKEFSAWLKWASALFAVAATMTQLGEYGWAMFFLVLCGLCCLTQVAIWTASPSVYKNAIWKGLLSVFTVALLAVAGLTLWRIKGGKPWSNLEGHQVRETPILPLPSPIARPSPSEQTLLAATPTPFAATPSPLSSLNVPLTPRNDIPFKGGITYRLSELMAADGYAGTTDMAELYVQTDDANQGETRIGPQPNLNAKNSTLLQGGGERMDYRNGADTRSIYVRSDKDGKFDVMYKPR